MANRAPDLTYEEAQRLVANDVRMLNERLGSPASQLGQSKASRSVTEVVQSMCQDEVSLDRGELISRIHRLPQHWTNQLLEYVTGVKPYDGRRHGIDLEIDIINAGDQPHMVTIDVDEIPGIDPNTGEETMDYSYQKKYRWLDPGEVITIDSGRASGMLYRHGHQAQKPGLWRGGSYSPKKKPLREIGFRAKFTDAGSHSRELITVEAPGKAMKKTKAA